MKKERIILIFLYDSFIKAYKTTSIRASYDIVCKLYNNNAYSIIVLEEKNYEKIDRTTLKLYDYMEEN